MEENGTNMMLKRHRCVGEEKAGVEITGRGRGGQIWRNNRYGVKVARVCEEEELISVERNR